MIASVRTSRRTMFGGLILCVFSIVGFMVVKDMNDKLSVMTSSNSGYQKMTDSQASRITQLNTDLKSSKKTHQKQIDSMQKVESELKTKLAKSDRQVKQLTPYKEQATRLQNELDTFKQKHDIEMQQAEEEHTRMLKLLADSRRNEESEQDECREKIQKIEDELDQCKTPYSNLFKAHQEATDTIQRLQNENKDLQKQNKILQNRPSAAAIVTSASNAKPLEGRQIQIPQSNKQIVQPIVDVKGVTSKRGTVGSNPPLPVAAAPAAVSTAKSVNANQNFLEEPKLVGKSPILLNARDNNRGVVPVAAEPPLAKNTQKGEFMNIQNVHQNVFGQEDAMEAPKNVNSGKQINFPKIQVLGQPRKVNVGQNGHGVWLHGNDNAIENNVISPAPRIKTGHGIYSGDVQALHPLNRQLQQPRQIQQPLILRQRGGLQHSGVGENLDQQVDNVDQDHPYLQRPLDTGRLNGKYLEEEVENQMDDNVDGRILNRQHFVEDDNDEKVNRAFLCIPLNVCIKKLPII